MPDIFKTSGEVRLIPDNVDETRTIPFIASTSTKDRHGTILNQAGWDLKNFNKNPIIGYQHNVYGDSMCDSPNPDDVIGKAIASSDGNILAADITFEPADMNPLADKVFRKIRFGTLRAVSVGFTPTGKGKFGDGEKAQGKPDQTYFFEGQELLEISVVNLPSNPEALKKSLRDSTANALRFVRNALGEDATYAEIEKMTVADVIRMIEKGEIFKNKTKMAENVHAELSEDLELKKYRTRQLLLKQNS